MHGLLGRRLRSIDQREFCNGLSGRAYSIVIQLKTTADNHSLASGGNDGLWLPTDNRTKYT